MPASEVYLLKYMLNNGILCGLLFEMQITSFDFPCIHFVLRCASSVRIHWIILSKVSYSHTWGQQTQKWEKYFPP